MFPFNPIIQEFQFQEFSHLEDGEIYLEIDEHLSGARAMDRVPAYKFGIYRLEDKACVGDIDVRIGNTDHLMLYGGHIGYSIFKPYRGNRYAAKASLIIAQVALFHGMKQLWITCNPDNLASRKTCEIIGAELINIVKVPKNTEIYRRGDTEKCRYQWNIEPLRLPVQY